MHVFSSIQYVVLEEKHTTCQNVFKLRFIICLLQNFIFLLDFGLFFRFKTLL
jgi:hypothetical protein